MDSSCVAAVCRESRLLYAQSQALLAESAELRCWGTALRDSTVLAVARSRQLLHRAAEVAPAGRPSLRLGRSRPADMILVAPRRAA